MDKNCKCWICESYKKACHNLDAKTAPDNVADFLIQVGNLIKEDCMFSSHGWLLQELCKQVMFTRNL